jgi:hypothetical protein
MGFPVSLSLTRGEVGLIQEMAEEARTKTDEIVTGIIRLYLEGKLVRPVQTTQIEHALIKELDLQGFSQTAIGERVGRSRSAVFRALKKIKNNS